MPGVALVMVDRMRLELITNALKGRCSTIELPVPFVPEPPPHSRGRMDDTATHLLNKNYLADSKQWEA